MGGHETLYFVALASGSRVCELHSSLKRKSFIDFDDNFNHVNFAL